MHSCNWPVVISFKSHSKVINKAWLSKEWENNSENSTSRVKQVQVGFYLTELYYKFIDLWRKSVLLNCILSPYLQMLKLAFRRLQLGGQLVDLGRQLDCCLLVAGLGVGQLLSK